MGGNKPIRGLAYDADTTGVQRLHALRNCNNVAQGLFIKNTCSISLQDRALPAVLLQFCENLKGRWQ